MSAREDLHRTVAKLKAALDTAEKDLVEQNLDYGGTDPYIIQDSNGRYLLLDALTALAGAQTSLAILDNAHEQTVKQEKREKLGADIQAAFNEHVFGPLRE